MFRMITSDGEVYVLPMKYQKDLRHLNLSKISSLDAQYEVSSLLLAVPNSSAKY